MPRRWASVFCKLALAVVACVWSLPLIAQDRTGDSALPKRRSARPLRIAVDMGWTFGLHSIDFFSEYKRLLSGPASTFDVPVTVRGSVSTFLSQTALTGLQIGYHRAVLRESYLYTPFGLDTATRARQTLSQDVTLSAIPVLLTFDYHPRNRQFTTYVGGGIGLNIASLVWNESPSASQLAGARSSGTRYNDTHIFPAAMARAGMSLGWDRTLSDKVSGALHLEFSYLYAPFSGPFFETISAQTGIAVPSSYTIHTGGIGLHLGVSLYVR